MQLSSKKWSKLEEEASVNCFYLPESKSHLLFHLEFCLKNRRKIFRRWRYENHRYLVTKHRYYVLHRLPTSLLIFRTRFGSWRPEASTSHWLYCGVPHYQGEDPHLYPFLILLMFRRECHPWCKMVQNRKYEKKTQNAKKVPQNATQYTFHFSHFASISCCFVKSV